VQDAPGQQPPPQVRAELVMVIAVDGERPGQEQASPSATKTPTATNSYSRSPRMAGSKSIKPGQLPCPLWALGDQQMLAHDLGVQQHRRARAQHHRLQDPGIWSAHAAGKPRARCSLTARAHCRATNAP
jgi:hypothetical protein